MMIRPYPKSWHRRLSFVPPLGLEIALGEENLELYYCQTAVTLQEEKRPSREIPTEYGKIRVVPDLRNRVYYEMGDPNPMNGINPLPQKEILSDIMDHLGDAVSFVGSTPDVVTKNRGVVEKIPNAIEGLEPFQGSENVFYLQDGYGSFIHLARRAFPGTLLADPYRFIKSDLLYHNIIKSARDPILKKLRSILKTEFLITDARGTDMRGYSSLGDANILLLEQALTRNKWWVDIGKPVPFESRVDSSILRGQVYRLLNRGELIII